MIFTSKFSHTVKQPNLCSACHRPINKGDRVEYKRGGKGQTHAVCGPEGQAVKKEIQKSYASNTDFNPVCPEGLVYLPYQKAGIEFALARKSTLIADDMGLGKTVQAIGFINAQMEGEWAESELVAGLNLIRGNGTITPSILVVCPASLKLNWLYELEKWIVRTGVLTFDIWPGFANIQVINYDILHKLDPFQIRQLVIIDEAHYIKNPEARRTKLIMEIVKHSERNILLTGTPILSHTKDLWPILQICAADLFNPDTSEESKDFFTFAKRYCGAKQETHYTKTVWRGVPRSVPHTHWNFDGASNLDELQEKLRSTCMVRRMKKDVLKELPPKRRQMIVLPGEKNDGLGWVSDDFDTAVKQLQTGGKIPFEEISKIRHENALLKIPGVLAHVKECLENNPDGKLILWAHHTDVIEGLLDGLITNFYVSKFMGSTSIEHRQSAVEEFQNGQTQVFIASISAAGVGLTLTASSHEIFAEEDWNPSVVTQAEDRAHRIGQENNLLIQHLVMDKTIDVKMCKMLLKKQDIADRALDVDTMPDVSNRPKG